MSQDMPDSLKDAGTQLKYYAPKYAEKGVSQQEILMLQATADRLGYGQGKSGTGFLQIYRNLLDPSTKKMAYFQDQLGISGTYINKQGVFDPEGLFNHLHTLYAQALKQGKGREFDEALNSSFSSNAGLIAGVMSSNAGRTQYENVKQTMARVHDLPLAQAQLMATLNHQTQLLTSNFHTLVTMIAKPWMANFTAAVGKAADALGHFAQYMADHPTVAKATGGVMMAIGIAGAALAVAKFGRFFGVSEHLGKLGHIFLGGHRSASAGKVGGMGKFIRNAFSFSETGEAAKGLGKFFVRMFKWTGPSVPGFGADMAKGMRGIPGVRLLESVVEHLGAVGKVAAFAVKFVATHIGWLGGIVGRLGLKAIPVVGQVLMLIDILQFMGKHVNQIGYYIGLGLRKFVDWMKSDGNGMIIGAFKSMIFGILDILKWVMNPMNLINFVKDGISAFKHGFYGVDMGGPSTSPADRLKGMKRSRVLNHGVLGNTMGQPLSMLNSPLRSQAVGPVQVNVKVVNNH